MKFGKDEFTLLSEEQTFKRKKIDVIKQIGRMCAISDFAILLGAFVSDDCHVVDDNSLRGRTSWWYLSSSNRSGDVSIICRDGSIGCSAAGKRSGGIRPVLSYSNLSDISTNSVIGKSGVLEVEYGEYPQYAVDLSLGRTLESEFSESRLKKTGKTYTTDSNRWHSNSESFSPIEHEEFEYNGKRYVRVKSNCYEEGYRLSNGVLVMPNDIVWLEVSPIKWYVDERSKMLISKTLLASGIRFLDDGLYRGDFKNTEMYTFLNTYFAKDMVSSVVHEMIPEEKSENEVERKQTENRRTPYAFSSINTDNIKDKKIEETINKISELCNNLPDKIKTDIMNKVNDLVNNYNDNIDDLKPEYNIKDEIKLSFNNPQIDTVRPTLLSKLELILYSLSSIESSKEFIENLDKYKNYLNKTFDNYSDGETIDDKIKNTIYYTKYMDDKNKEKTIYQLSKCINDTIGFASLDINKILEKNEPELKFEGDYKTNFELKIDELYNKANNETKKVRGFVDLLDAINNKESAIRKGSDLKDLIYNFNYVISKISNAKYKEKIEEDKKQMFNKYKNVLGKIIDNDELQTGGTLNEIEMSIRKDFQEILEDVQKYVYLDKYEQNKGNKANLDTQLKNSLDIIDSSEKVELTEDYKLQPITSYVIEIQNKITENTSINSKTKNSVREDVKNKLNKWINHLDKDLVDDLAEYNEVLNSILSDLAETEVHLDDYLDDMEDYEKVANSR